jgi:toxin ParE1/3/4
LRFADAVETAFILIGRQSGIGSPRFAHELQIPGLRSWALTGSPHVLLYLDREDVVGVVRVLHGSRDIPDALMDSEPR